MSDRSPLFFIVASARSGTTFLRLALNAHPKIAVPYESRFIVELYEGPEVDRDTFLDRLRTHPRFQTWELDIAEVAAAIGNRTHLLYAEAVEAAYSAYARAQGKERWGDKTPRYVEHIPFLAQLFPETRFIHVIRDGRNVALSYSHVDFGPKNLARAARLWRRRVLAGVRDGRALPPGRYLEIRSEDLAEDPEGELRDICSFLSVDFDPLMLDESARVKGEMKGSKRNYDPKASGRARMSSWQQDMGPRDVEVFEVIAGDALSMLGYERRYPEPGLRAKAAARLGLAGLPLSPLR